MAPLADDFTYDQWSLVYNSLSFGIAGMGSATIFFWLQLPNVTKNYRTALIITGLVTAIATYHYVRIFNSWCDAFHVKMNASISSDYTVKTSGAPFNDAYRYVDWLLTVPLLLIELILVMKLPKDETVSLGWKLGLAAAIMVALGYPGEIQDDLMVRWIWWALAMVPFTSF
jgi:bacteriorhodopsin